MNTRLSRLCTHASNVFPVKKMNEWGLQSFWAEKKRRAFLKQSREEFIEAPVPNHGKSRTFWKPGITQQKLKHGGHKRQLNQKALMVFGPRQRSAKHPNWRSARHLLSIFFVLHETSPTTTSANHFPLSGAAVQVAEVQLTPAEVAAPRSDNPQSRVLDPTGATRTSSQPCGAQATKEFWHVHPGFSSLPVGFGYCSITEISGTWGGRWWDVPANNFRGRAWRAYRLTTPNAETWWQVFCLKRFWALCWLRKVSCESLAMEECLLQQRFVKVIPLVFKAHGSVSNSQFCSLDG